MTARLDDLNDMRELLWASIRQAVIAARTAGGVGSSRKRDVAPRPRSLSGRLQQIVAPEVDRAPS